MKEKLIDLHMHSSYSDGDLSPDELIKECIKNNIKTISITDHDTIEGNKNISLKYKNNDEIKIISGIELSARVSVGTMHILGYDIDINNRVLNDKIPVLKNNSIYHIIGLLTVLKKDYNITFSTEDIKELICSNKNIGRPDLAKLCIKYGYCKSVSDAFDKYLIDSYEKIRSIGKGISYKECIDLITVAGGIPVLAHPKTLKLNDNDLLKLIKNMKEYGLKGIEVYNSIHTKEDIEKYLKIASDLNLLISGGSDYHGEKTKPDIKLGTGKNNNLYIKKLSILSKIM